MNQYKKNLLKKTLSLSLLLSCFVYQQRTITTPVEYTVIAGKKCNFNVNSYYDNSGTTVGDTGNIILGNGNQGGAIGIYSSKANPIQMINYAHDLLTTSGGIEIAIVGLGKIGNIILQTGNTANEIDNGNIALVTPQGQILSPTDLINNNIMLATTVTTPDAYIGSDVENIVWVAGNTYVNADVACTTHIGNTTNGGNVTIESNGNITETADGNIAETAGGNITETAGGDITETAGGDIILDAVVDISVDAGGDISAIAVNDISATADRAILLQADYNVTDPVYNSRIDMGSNSIELRSAYNATDNDYLSRIYMANGNIDVNAGNDITQTANGAILLQANYDSSAYNCKIDMVNNRVSIISDGDASYTLRGSPTSSIQNITLGAAPSSTIEDLNKNNLFDIAHGKTLLLPYTGGQTVSDIQDLEPNIRYQFAKNPGGEGYFTTGVNTTMTMHGNGTFKLNRVAGGLGFITQEYVDEQQFSILAADQITFTQSTTYASFADSLPDGVGGAAFTAPADYTITVPADNQMQNCIVLAARDFTAAGNYENSVIVSGDKIILKSPSIVLNGETYFTINEINDSSTYYAVVTDGNGQLFAKAKESNPALSPSSRRYKTNIDSLTDMQSSQIYDIGTYSFNYKNDLATVEYGLIAEELVENDTLACAVRYDRQGRPDSVSYNTIMIALLKEVQKLKNRVDEIEQNQWNDEWNINDMQQTLNVLQDIIYNNYNNN